MFAYQHNRMAKHQLKINTIYCGDNLKMLNEVPDESIDLIYIDPPFNSNRDYEVFWGDSQEKRAFTDRFGDAKAYIEYMEPRVRELYRVLKKTGSIYYQCDWHASHYIKILLDQVFGFNNFQNEIIWKRTTAHNTTSKKYGATTDSILFYTKSNKYTFHPPQSAEHDESYISTAYRHKDERGTYRLHSIERNAALGIRPNLIYPFKGYTPKWGWMMEKVKLEKFENEGMLVWSSNGRPQRKIYLHEVKKPVIGNLWDDISNIQSSKESLGYPTQKPIALLDRIINASSNEGDMVLDAFCGCGTALVSAQKLNRKWIGIDISPTACKVMSQRLWDIFKLDEGKDFYVADLKKDESELRKLPHFEFQNWACIALGGIPNKRKSGDFGIDGKLYPIDIEKKKAKGTDLFGESDIYYPIQVKQIDKAGRPDIDSFETAIRRDGRKKGYFLAFDFSKEAITEIKRLDKEGDIEIIPITVNQLIKMESF